MAIETLYRDIEVLLEGVEAKEGRFSGCSFEPDFDFLSALLAVPLEAGAGIRSGDMPACLDLWIAEQFASAGFERHLLWPGRSLPRVVDPAVQQGIGALSPDQSRVARRVVDASGASKDAYVLGTAYCKQVDVGMASWPSGPELLVSTKTMSGSYDKNLKNRFEEAYGDVMNLRGRHPLAAHGYCFLIGCTIADSPNQLTCAIHTVRQLRETAGGYDAAAIVMYDPMATDGKCVTADLQKPIPDDLSARSFFATLISVVLKAAPANWHETARAMWECR